MLASLSRFSPLVVAALTGTALAQVPDGYAVFGAFGGGTGQGIYFCHPRDAAAPPVAVTNLPQNLSSAGSGSRGVASLLRRPKDGALIVGERAPANASVDVHVLHLSGSAVTFAQLFSCGTSMAAGEVPQMGLLPDGRVVVGASDLQPGSQLAHFSNGSFNWQGLSILNTTSGQWQTIAVTNWSSFAGVINGLAVSRDGATVYIGAWISSASGALWAVPVGGGAAAMVAAMPFGASNVTIDQDDTVLVTALNGPPNLFRYDPVSSSLTPVPSTSGPLNAIAIEPATGNYMICTANAGLPARSIVWRTPGGTENVLQVTPTAATLSAVDVNPNPESYGEGTPAVAAYEWVTAPNPGGLPETGNDGFSLTVAASQAIIAQGFFAFSNAAIEPVSALGVNILIDPTSAILFDGMLFDTATFPIPIPAAPSLVGTALFGQSFWFELVPGGGFAASPGISFTVL
jgi:hypothetical protein